jgi:hypothetical protein
MRFYQPGMNCPRLDRQGVQAIGNLEAEEQEQDRPNAVEVEARPEVAMRERAE